MDLTVELFADGEAVPVGVVDLSRTGMFLELSPPLPVGSNVHVAMFFEGRQLATAATVVHGIADTTAHALGRQPGNGLVFAPPTRHADALFMRAVDRLLAIRARSVAPKSRVILRGELAEIGLPAMLVMLEQERKTCRVALASHRATGATAWIELVNGCIVAAGADGHAGDLESTVLTLLDWCTGDFEIVATTQPAAIRGPSPPITYLLLEHARRIDERLRCARN